MVCPCNLLVAPRWNQRISHRWNVCGTKCDRILHPGSLTLWSNMFQLPQMKVGGSSEQLTEPTETREFAAVEASLHRRQQLRLASGGASDCWPHQLHQLYRSMLCQKSHAIAMTSSLALTGCMTFNATQGTRLFQSAVEYMYIHIYIYTYKFWIYEIV